ncbi:MAG: PKD domain-containing protein [Myxococcales bacterium]|nr:PKD domain-containing protein [Myxococcales bacterium]
MRTTLSFTALIVAIGCTGSATTEETASAVEPNDAPIAEAGATLTQTADTRVQLNGAASSDPNGDPLTYHWSFDRLPEGSELATKEKAFSSNETAAAVQPTFQPDRVGTFIIKLVVKDGKADSLADFVTVTVIAPDNLPVASAGTDVTGAMGTTIALDGAASYDPKGRTLTYAWTLIDKPMASTLAGLTAGDSAAPSFVPDARGNYTVNLVVNNGLANSVADAAVITVTGEDGEPIANAGEDMAVEDCTSVTLRCDGSIDPDGDALRYFWSIQNRPGSSTAENETSFSDRTAANPTFWADQAGNYVLSCAVFDGQNWSSPDLVTLAATDRSSNSKPVADAGADTSVSGGNAECVESGYVYNCDECAATTINLGDDARATDPDGDPIVIEWTVVEGDATISNNAVVSTTASLTDAEPTEPGACEDVDYTFKMTVTDCTGESTSDTVKFTLSCCGVEDTGP